LGESKDREKATRQLSLTEVVYTNPKKHKLSMESLRSSWYSTTSRGKEALLKRGKGSAEDQPVS